MTTHWVAPFTRRRADGTQEAFCGTWVTEAQYSTTPECPNCRHLMEQDAEDLDALKSMTFDAAMQVKHEPFDPTAGYTPRTSR